MPDLRRLLGGSRTSAVRSRVPTSRRGWARAIARTASVVAFVALVAAGFMFAAAADSIILASLVGSLATVLLWGGSPGLRRQVYRTGQWLRTGEAGEDALAEADTMRDRLSDRYRSPLGRWRD